jgi:hypothetical protein
MEMKKKEINTDFIFIQAYTDITLSSICNELNVNIQNVSKGTASKEKIKEVKNLLEKKLTKLLLTGGNYEE